ncbi:DUF4236 domain-containing protein [Endozoicomonas sp. Mp262]|uniref:DUF4236 domain-containing protein n=1 Tax=Endozoicomonas sp. Mp262 TaxID=2919499 RepID=UPI0021E077DE
MGYRFRRTIKILPGVRLNLSKSGVSVSAGVKGASVTAGKNGVYANVGVPGSGLSYRTRIDKPGGSMKDRVDISHMRVPSAEDNIYFILDSSHRLLIQDDEGNSFPEEQAWRIRQHHWEDMTALLRMACARLNGPLLAITHIHESTPKPDSTFDWSLYYCPLDEPVPEEPGYQPISWLDRLLPWRRKAIEESNQRLESQYRSEQVAWQRKVDEHEQQQRARWNDRFASVANATAFLYEVLGRLEWPHKVDTRLIVDSTMKRIALETHFPEITELPGIEYKVQEKEWRLISKGLTPTKKRKLYMHYVHGIGFRLIGEIFRAIPVQTITFTGHTQRLNSATASFDEECLYSVKVPREAWQQVDFSTLDELSLPELMATFDLRRNMTKTGIFRSVEPFSVISSEQLAMSL